MEVLLQAFGNVSTKARSLESKIGSVDAVFEALKVFHKTLQASTNVHRVSLWTIHQSELERIRLIIKGHVSGNKTLNSVFDKVFINMLSSRQSHTTIVFTKFIKGITYFMNEYFTDDTVYHRIQSCGSYQAIRTCDGTEGDKERRSRVYTCYLERLIWDAIFKHETTHIPGSFDDKHKQDDEHEDRLNTTRKEFQTCFPNSDLIVELEFCPQPFQLTIYHIQNKRVQSKEIYVREISHQPYGAWDYCLVVDCVRHTKKNTCAKFQTFYNKSRWVPIRKNNKARSQLTFKSSSHVDEMMKLNSV